MPPPINVIKKTKDYKILHLQNGKSSDPWMATGHHA